MSESAVAQTTWKEQFWFRLMLCSLGCLALSALIPVAIQVIKYERRSWEDLLEFYVSRGSLCLTLYIVSCVAAIKCTRKGKLLVALGLIHVCVFILIGIAFT